MTQDEIIEMARQAGFTVISKKYILSPYGFEDADLSEELSNFYDLSIMKEQESLAVLCETWFDPMWHEHNQAGHELARAIRSRGKA